jgi:hypothetical protein
MTYPETITQNQERQSAWLTMPVHDSNGEIIDWVILNYTYIESEYAFRRTEITIAADRPYYFSSSGLLTPYVKGRPVEDEDIIYALKSFYSDKDITEIVIS